MQKKDKSRWKRVMYNLFSPDYEGYERSKNVPWAFAVALLSLLKIIFL